jgi:hypothetical protein
MRNGTSGPRVRGAAWRAWAAPSLPSLIDADLATMLDRGDDTECGLRTRGRWSRRRW